MTTAPEHNPRLLAIVSKDSYQKALREYPHEVHAEIFQGNVPFIYRLIGQMEKEKGEEIVLPLESIPAPLETLLQNAELKKESSRPWRVPSEDEELFWVPGATAREWLGYDFKVAHYQTSAYDFVKEVLGIGPDGGPDGRVRLWPEPDDQDPKPLSHYQRFWPVENLISAGILYEKPRPQNKVEFCFPIDHQQGGTFHDDKITQMNNAHFPFKTMLERARLFISDVGYDEQQDKYHQVVDLMKHPDDRGLFPKIKQSLKEKRYWENSKEKIIGVELTFDSAQLPELGYYQGDEQRRDLTLKISNRRDEYAVTENRVDLMVIAFLEEHRWHQEPMFEHTFGEGWRARGGGGSCWR